jgi:hypothetical protein
MRPPVLRDELVHRGMKIKHYSNQLAVIHNTLLRLKRQGEVIPISGAWLLTEKGKLAAQLDSIDMPGSRRRNNRTSG